MKQLLIVLLGLSATVFIPIVQANETICRSDITGDERRILIDYPTQYTLPCKTYYTQGGVRSEEAWAENTAGICERVADDIVRNLIDAQYECQVVEYKEKEPRPASEVQ